MEGSDEEEDAKKAKDFVPFDYSGTDYRQVNGE